jgi:hypothetical protein
MQKLMKIQHKTSLFFGWPSGFNFVRMWQLVSRCFCGSSVRFEVVSPDDIFWVLCVAHVAFMTVKAFVVVHILSDITCQTNLFVLLMFH